MNRNDIDAGQFRALANAIRFLTLDAVQRAESGHAGLPLGMADVASVLFGRFLKFDAGDPSWPDRDRFVLSAGHGSMLLYSLLWLTGYPDIDLDQIRSFRKVGSRAAGHPEYRHLPGIETTTGPLGQGIGNAVGMALAERLVNGRFGDDLVSHRTYVIASDGDLMEGISHEAIGLAGHLKLSRLIVLWDDNSVTIDGPKELSDSTDQLKRFEAAGWQTDHCDGQDIPSVFAALERAQDATRPVLIACKTVIGFGMTGKEGTSRAHSDAPGVETVAATRVALDWKWPEFVIPDDLLSQWKAIGQRGKPERLAWEARLKGSAEREAFMQAQETDIPNALTDELLALKAKMFEEKKAAGTRKYSQAALEVINSRLPYTIGGSADLTPSNNTKSSGMHDVTAGVFSERYIHFGIREHGMCAALNGMALHGGLLPYGGTFLTFSDYCRPSIRLASFMGVHVIFVMTHDSIGVGEDGPTHQPVEQLAALRAIPGLVVFRPADGVETVECWQYALQERSRPTLLALSRQAAAAVRQTHTAENLSARGAYEVYSSADAKVSLLASGTEVGLALAACRRLEEQGISTRVVSMPSWLLFEEQPETYRREVLGPGTVRVGIEAGVREGWDRYIGSELLGEPSAFVGMSTFGASGPFQDVYDHFHITVDAIVDAAQTLVASLR